MSSDQSVPYVHPPFHEVNRLTHCVPQSASEVGSETVKICFEDGRSLMMTQSLVPNLLQVMGVSTLAQLSGVEVDVTSEPLVGYAQLQPNVFVRPLVHSAA